MLKLNWDAVVDNKGSSTGIGVVAWNDEGELMVSICQNINCLMKLVIA